MIFCGVPQNRQNFSEDPIGFLHERQSCIRSIFGCSLGSLSVCKRVEEAVTASSCGEVREDFGGSSCFSIIRGGVVRMDVPQLWQKFDDARFTAVQA